MSARKLLSIAVIAGILSSTVACADVTAPQPEVPANGFCAVTGGGQTC